MTCMTYSPFCAERGGYSELWAVYHAGAMPVKRSVSPIRMTGDTPSG